jgi:23S rRNA-/tRNA-specific pseudouridylate synthase
VRWGKPDPAERRPPTGRDHHGIPIDLPKPQPPDIFLHFAGAGLLVAEKPAGLLCQPGLGPELADSLLSRLRRRWPAAQLMYRLDRETSGLLLLPRLRLFDTGTVCRADLGP